MAEGFAERGSRRGRGRYLAERRAAQIRNKVGAELAYVIFGTMNEARFAPAHEVEAQRVETGRVDDAPVMPQVAFTVERGYPQPAIVGAEAGSPKHGADAVRREIEHQPGRLRRARRSE